MTAKQLTALARKWQARLVLDAWRITYEHADEPGDCWAMTSPSRQYRAAKITFDPGLKVASTRLVEQTIVHELIHVLMRDADRAFADAADQLHPQAGEQATKRYEHAVEGFVDSLAEALIALPAKPSPARAGKRAASSRRAPRRSG